MLEPSLPDDETDRLMSLHTLRILDTPSESRFDRITRMAKRYFGVEICLISLIDARRQWFKSRQGLEAAETSRQISFCGHAILDDSVFIVNNALEDLRFADNPLVAGEPNIRFYAGCPIKDPNGFRVGTLCIIDSAPRDMSVDDVCTLKDLAMMVEDEVRLSSQVTTDDLTGVANRRGFHVIADHLLSLCSRTGVKAELAFFDLDGFKEINDNHGHAAGDELLRHFSQLLVKCFRTADAIGRLGGDEFAVLLTDTDSSSETALKRLRDMANATACDIRQKLAWSVGTVDFDPHRHDTIESLIADADSYMYTDKVRRRRASA